MRSEVFMRLGEYQIAKKAIPSPKKKKIHQMSWQYTNAGWGFKKYHKMSPGALFTFHKVECVL